MTNAEKYPNTQGALEAWRMYGDRGGDKPFDLWLSLSADIAPEPTLLEAAEKLIVGYVNTWSEGWSSMECLENLRKAVKREKNKPIRNCDRYNTTRSATRKWAEITGASIYAEGDGNDWRKFFHWLFAPAQEGGVE